ncbi:MAG: HAD family hydrolase [Treponema sp.]
MKKLCIFDLDGTLTNTLASIAYFLNEELKKYDIPLITEDEVKIFTGDGAYTLVDRVLKKNKIDDPSLLKNILASYVSKYDADYLYLCKLYPGIKETIDQLKKRNIAVACLTNKPHQTAVSIISNFFGDSFSIVWGQREGFPIKPNPSGAFEIMKKLKLEAKDTLYIGDTKTDVLTGKGAECFTIGVLWGFRDKAELEQAGADAIISQPNELLDFL